MTPAPVRITAPENSAESVDAVRPLDEGAVWHYGNPMREQRNMEAGNAVVDLTHRDVISVSGPDRLSWLHSLTTQHVESLAPGVGTTALILSPTGHIEHVMYAVDDGETFWAHTEPDSAPALVEFLTKMQFMMRVEVTDRSAEMGIVWAAGPDPGDQRITRVGSDSLGGHESFVTLDHVDDLLNSVYEGVPHAGLWAYEARRIAAGVARIGVDTDHRTIPNEVGLLGVGVHLNKGCYRGQETIARVNNLGRPPRRLVLLHLDGSADALPERGSELHLRAPADPGKPSRAVGISGSSARHFELGPIGLGLLKRSVPVEVELLAGGIAAGQEVLVDPEIGLHVRTR